MCIHEWVLFCRRIISSDYTYLEYQNIELFLSFTKIPFERIYFADNWPHRIWGHSRSPIILILLKPVIQYESYFKMHYTFLVQLLQEYPITDSQFQKLLFQSSDSSSLWIRVLRAADQSLTNISFCVGWTRLITHARIILLKKRKSKEIRTEGWNYISVCLKKCEIKRMQ